jgi:hypothetical protein
MVTVGGDHFLSISDGRGGRSTYCVCEAHAHSSLSSVLRRCCTVFVDGTTVVIVE